MAALFSANAAGYVALTVALYHPHPVLRRYRRAVRWALIGFAALTVLACFALAQGHVDAFGVADKLIEGLLIALLVVEDRRARRRAPGAAGGAPPAPFGGAPYR
jgi:threonine/homoserine efflux transporter RhtA